MIKRIGFALGSPSGHSHARCALALAATAVLLAGCGGKSLSDQPGYARAHEQAGIYCTLGGIAPPNAGAAYLNSDRYLRCVKDQTEQLLAQRNAP